MNRRQFFSGISVMAVAAGVSSKVGAMQSAVLPVPAKTPPPEGPRETLLLDRGWRFHEGDIPMPLLVTHDDTYNAAKAGRALGAAAVAFDDSGWEKVTLPHDFASFQPIEQSANVDQGYRRRGIAWYRNHLTFGPEDHGKHIELQLDGVATFSTVWFNGTLVNRNWSGYSSAYIDLTPYVDVTKDNVLVVRVDATAMEGWWYEGAGIYRDAWIVKRNPVHIVTDGVFAHPVKGENGEWTIPVEVTVNNTGASARNVTIKSTLMDVLPATDFQVNGTVEALQSSVLKTRMPVDSPLLWSIEYPTIYTVRTQLYDGDQLVDEVTTTCGFRTTRWDANTGFYLNDKPVKIKGVCLHQDHAGVGTAIPEGVIEYRLRRLKETGCNAIRMSHNAQNKVLMDACDRHGFLVMAENRNFNASPDYAAQLEWLVRRDRNHPSVYLWSVFNEEPMQATEQGYEMVRRMSAVVKALDTTRPVTAAMNGGLDAPLSVAHAVDVVGINYQQDWYDRFHAAHPEKPVFSSEDTSAFMTRGEYKTDQDRHIMASYDEEPAPWGETHRAAWKAVHDRPFVAGQFVWTGFDYHGEPTPFTFPSNSSYFGIMDLCGFEKAAFHIHRAQWIDDQPVLGLVPHWNWTPGEQVRVMACTNCEEVELFVNGKSAGRQKGDRLEMNAWTVPYAPGFIEVRGYKDGKVVAKARNETTGPAVALRLTPDRKTLTGDGRDAMPVKVEAVDAKGRVVPDAAHAVTFGGSVAIIGLGNGDPTDTSAEKGDTRKLFHGLAQVIIQAPDANAGWKGPVNLTAVAEGLKAATLTVPVSDQGAAVARQATT